MKFKQPLGNLAAVAFCLLAALHGAAALDLGQPISHLGYSDAQGRIIFWRDVTSVGLDQKTFLPVRWRFSAAPGIGAPTFGRFWYCALLQSTLVPWNERVLTWNDIAGNTLYLRKKKDGSFVSPDGSAVAKALSSSELILAHGGWEFRYVGGRLKNLTIDQNFELEWDYQGTRLLGISEKRRGTLLTLEYSAGQSFPTAMVVGKGRYEFAYQKVPIAGELSGAVVIAGYDSLLESIDGPGAREKYSIVLDQNGEYQMSGFFRGDKIAFRWSGVSGNILSDGYWRYGIEPDAKVGPIVKRTDPQGREESYYYNEKTGSSMHRLPDGKSVLRNYFVADGPTQGKIRRCAEIENGKEVAVHQWSYDDTGRLVRDRAGNFERSWDWDAKGNLLREAQSFNDKLIYQVSYDGDGRPTERFRNGKTYKYSYEMGKKLVQRVENGKVLNTKVIDSATGSVAFFKPDEKTGVLEGTMSSAGKMVSPQELENARALAEQSLRKIENENSGK